MIESEYLSPEARTQQILHGVIAVLLLGIGPILLIFAILARKDLDYVAWILGASGMIFIGLGISGIPRLRAVAAARRQVLQADEVGIRRVDVARWDTTWDRVESVRLLVGRLGATCIVVEKPECRHRRPGYRLFWSPIGPADSLICGLSLEATPALAALVKRLEIPLDYRDLRFS